MLNERPDHPISRAISGLLNVESWRQARLYRDRWVHSKPPIVKGLGIEYERRNRVEITDTYVGIRVGRGDEPEYTVDELMEIILPAAHEFQCVVKVVIEEYERMLAPD